MCQRCPSCRWAESSLSQAFGFRGLPNGFTLLMSRPLKRRPFKCESFHITKQSFSKKKMVGGGGVGWSVKQETGV